MLIFFFLVYASPATAQPGAIGIFTDPWVSSCDFVDAVPGLVPVYVVHVYTPGATSARFAFTWNSGVKMTYLGEAVTAPYTAVGTSRTGIRISYGSCVVSPNLILTIHFWGEGKTDPCSYLFTVPDPGVGVVLVEDCADPPNTLISRGDCAPVNNDGTCPCSSYCPEPPTPIEESTWGCIKAMYKQ